MPDIASDPGRLTAAEKSFLRQLAHLAVAAAAGEGAPPDARALAHESGLELTPRLAAKRGAFVTLHLAGQLRGCIGYIEGHVSLLDAVVRNGRAAACEDPRFAPVSRAELPLLEIEISALTPLRTVATVAEIEIGRHGILLAKGVHRAVFLPQVAGEQGWDLNTTLDHLALKAGLAAGDWREDAHFQVFEAEVF